MLKKKLTKAHSLQPSSIGKGTSDVVSIYKQYDNFLGAFETTVINSYTSELVSERICTKRCIEEEEEEMKKKN